jgi:hypothetical protein
MKKTPARLTLRMRASGWAGPLILFKFQQEKQEMPVRYLRRKLSGLRGETASGSPYIGLDRHAIQPDLIIQGAKNFSPLHLPRIA